MKIGDLIWVREKSHPEKEFVLMKVSNNGKYLEIAATCTIYSASYYPGWGQAAKYKLIVVRDLPLYLYMTYKSHRFDELLREGV
jgi:hypothetical protein